MPASAPTGPPTQGTIGHYLHFQADRPVIGVLVELTSETDFVAKSDEFQDDGPRPRDAHRCRPARVGAA